MRGKSYDQRCQEADDNWTEFGTCSPTEEDYRRGGPRPKEETETESDDGGT
jgi:hypothetical protein